jgi:uncharacterized protein with GYD domain
VIVHYLVPAWLCKTPKEKTMPFYLIRAAYSGTAAAHMVQHPQHRETAVRKTCETLGGKLHHFFYCFGDYDAMAIVELPNNKAAAAAALSVEASGAVRQIQTTVLITVAEAMEAMKLAQSDKYTPPS